ncbi:MAG: hypothetical protein WBA74_06750 [Cyclobacteriaceae bacterium]
MKFLILLNLILALPNLSVFADPEPNRFFKVRVQFDKIEKEGFIKVSEYLFTKLKAENSSESYKLDNQADAVLMQVLKTQKTIELYNYVTNIILIHDNGGKEKISYVSDHDIDVLNFKTIKTIHIIEFLSVFRLGNYVRSKLKPDNEIEKIIFEGSKPIKIYKIAGESFLDDCGATVYVYDGDQNMENIVQEINQLNNEFPLKEKSLQYE